MQAKNRKSRADNTPDNCHHTCHHTRARHSFTRWPCHQSEFLHVKNTRDTSQTLPEISAQLVISG
jgi:hypothetical protein